MSTTPELEGRSTPGAGVEALGPSHWRLTLPPGPAGRYRWAQLDDYLGLPRSAFLWPPPLRLSLRARASQAGLPGTWGFGLWNDPFSAGLGLGGMARRLPALPNAAWFFHASPPNYLSLRDDLPAQGFLTATFSSARIPVPLLAPAAPALPLLAWPWAAGLLRRLARRLVGEDSAGLALDPASWHSYRLDWDTGSVRFYLDGELRFQTGVVPRAPLGLVLWIDNQYAAFPPSGRLRLGTLANSEPAWLELAEVAVDRPTPGPSRE